jgi:hypothetical protein
MNDILRKRIKEKGKIQMIKKSDLKELIHAYSNTTACSDCMIFDYCCISLPESCESAFLRWFLNEK